MRYLLCRADTRGEIIRRGHDDGFAAHGAGGTAIDSRRRPDGVSCEEEDLLVAVAPTQCPHLYSQLWMGVGAWTKPGE